jgi:hypothetical protein
MLKCSKCKEFKDETEYARNKGKKSGYNGTCNICKKQFQANWYLRHKDEQCVRASNTRKRVQDYVRQIKQITPCADCGVLYPYYVMDFDHIDGDKKFNLANSTQQGFLIVKKEIEKCEVVCSNCHRIRTHNRKHKDVSNGI